MAEVTALRNNALPYPVYGAPWGFSFPIFDNTGALVTAAAGLDSEISKNADGLADCTNEATEIPTSSGLYYLLLTATEMTTDLVTGQTKTSTANAKTTPWGFNPRKLVTLASGTAQGGAAGYITLAAGTITFDGRYNGCLCVATIDSNVEARILQVCTSSNQQCTVIQNWNVTPDSDDTYIIYLPEGMQIPATNVTHVAATAQTAGDIPAEVAKIPKSDSNVSWNATALAAIGDADHDEVIEGALTSRQIQRILLAVLAGKSGGGGTTTDTFRDVADAKNRVSATVNNLGNRTAVTLDGS